ncbi:NAD(P)/FAD-dependent oxidoreductase [Phenylobacterium sp.]|uniref:NAD(P)/FAD-dependent oxidoreductase n=1 Tax=Phenylobacterium sp. TaxID=1871053 RepID=UPI003D2CE119
MSVSRAGHAYDVIVVGGGPAGATMGWALARHGVRVAIVERATFPRDKVCGDFVEPGGLRLLARMGVLPQIESGERLRITRNRVYFGPKLIYRGDIHYYDHPEDRLNYGLVVSRREFDAILLQHAHDAGADVFSPATARAITRDGGMVSVEATIGDQALTLCAPLVVGADGTESVVAKSMGLRRTNRRHIGVAQRAYVKGVEIDGGEAAVWFDEEIAPGYGWMFPMPGGLANVGVGFSSETSQRFGLPVREAFERALARLRIRHPGCARAELASRPIGGVVKTYGGIDRNHFDGGLLIGDAGSFVDPLTGEGITHGMESAILALPTLLDALENGRFEANDLAGFDRDFRGYFDPAMRYLELSGALVSNRHLSEFWLRVGAHGHEEAAKDPAFARLAGSIFGGPALQPLAVSAQMWSRVFVRYAQAAAGTGDAGRFAEDFRAFQRGWTRSTGENPEWHAEWLRDVTARTLELQKTIWTRRNPRPDGVFRYIGLEDPAPGERPPPLASTETQAMLVETVRTVVEAGLAYLTSRSAPPVQAAEPRRRWRVKP